MQYLLQEVPSGRLVHPDLPLTAVSSSRQLSGPSLLSASLLMTDQIRRSLPVIRPYHHAIWCVAGNRVIGGGIVTERASDGDTVDLDCTGFTELLRGTPWTGEDWNGVQVDPLDVVRRMFDHVQSFPDGDLGVRVDSTTSPVRIGEEEKEVQFTTSTGEEVEFESGPYRLTWWARDDMGKALDDLAKDTPFDYLEETTFSATGFSHRLRLGYPRIGARKTSVRAVIGVNAVAYPALDDQPHFTAALFVGAGEGKKAVHAMVEGDKTTGLRRVAQPSDKRVGAKSTAANRARRAIQSKRLISFDTVTVADHSLSPVGGINPGDVILVSGDSGVEQLNHWVRVLAVDLDHKTLVQTLKVEAE